MDISVSSSDMMRPPLREPGREEVATVHQVIAGEGQVRGELDLSPTPSLRTPQQANVLRPAKGLLESSTAPAAATPESAAPAQSRSAGLGVELLELPIHLYQRLGDHRADRPQRVFRRHPVFRARCSWTFLPASSPLHASENLNRAPDSHKSARNVGCFNSLLIKTYSRRRLLFAVAGHELWLRAQLRCY